MRIVTLTTDFGLEDPYVGQMKAVIMKTAPTASVVDLTHAVPAQDVLAGALALESTIGAFGPEDIHVAVVDPGVGSDRAPVAVATDHGVFVGPNNGRFTIVTRCSRSVRAVRLTNPAYHRREVSHTFHGRDIFSPVAGHLANGVAIDSLGSPIDTLNELELPEVVEADGRLYLHVMRVDRFGTLITDLDAARFRHWLGDRAAELATFSQRHHRVSGLSRTFSDVGVGQLVAYIGSTGRVELAVRNGRADELLRVDPAEPIELSHPDARPT